MFIIHWPTDNGSLEGLFGMVAGVREINKLFVYHPPDLVYSTYITLITIVSDHFPPSVFLLVLSYSLLTSLKFYYLLHCAQPEQLGFKLQGGRSVNCTSFVSPENSNKLTLLFLSARMIPK